MLGLGIQFLWFVCGYFGGLKKLRKQWKVSVTLAMSLLLKWASVFNLSDSGTKWNTCQYYQCTAESFTFFHSWAY